MPHSTATEVYSRESNERTIERIVEFLQTWDLDTRSIQECSSRAFHSHFHNRFHASPMSITEKINTMWKRSNWFHRKKIEAAKKLALKKKKPYYRTHERW